MYNVKTLQQRSRRWSGRSRSGSNHLLEDFTDYDAVLVRSAHPKLHDVEFPKNLRCIARAGAGINNFIPIDRCSEKAL